MTLLHDFLDNFSGKTKEEKLSRPRTKYTFRVNGLVTVVVPGRENDTTLENAEEEAIKEACENINSRWMELVESQEYVEED
jgi:hypothetical protein